MGGSVGKEGPPEEAFRTIVLRRRHPGVLPAGDGIQGYIRRRRHLGDSCIKEAFRSIVCRRHSGALSGGGNIQEYYLAKTAVRTIVQRRHSGVLFGGGIQEDYPLKELLNIVRRCCLGGGVSRCHLAGSVSIEEAASGGGN